ncbi:MAG: glycine cleavage system protein H [Gammaproteobacteria bacterium]|nr:glycine cleavage system protein H [Gammaproteobacteria bacterium]
MTCNGCEFHPELYYDKDFQIWMAQDADGCLRVGMTDISQTIAGRILHVRVRKPGTQRTAGKPIATLESGKWAGPVPNLIDCVIEEGNLAVLQKPALLNQDPFGAWIARVRPADPSADVFALFVTGEEAQRGYCLRAQRENIHCERK